MVHNMKSQITSGYDLEISHLHTTDQIMIPGLEVITLELILRLRLKRNDWLLQKRIRKQQIITLHFESETVLKFYNLEA